MGNEYYYYYYFCYDFDCDCDCDGGDDGDGRAGRDDDDNDFDDGDGDYYENLQNPISPNAFAVKLTTRLTINMLYFISKTIF